MFKKSCFSSNEQILDRECESFAVTINPSQLFFALKKISRSAHPSGGNVASEPLPQLYVLRCIRAMVTADYGYSVIDDNIASLI